MEGAEKMESKDKPLKSQVAIRCAKAAILLSLLKSFPNRQFTTSIDDQREEKEMMMREIGDLKMELARERLKRKRIKLCGLMEVILQVMAVLSISTFLFSDCAHARLNLMVASYFAFSSRDLGHFFDSTL